MQRKCAGTHRHARVVQTTQARRWNKQEHGYVKLPRATEEQLREDEYKAKDRKRMRWFMHENDKNKGTNRLQDEIEKLVHHDELTLFSMWQGWHWDDTKGGLHDPELCAKARRGDV